MLCKVCQKEIKEKIIEYPDRSEDYIYECECGECEEEQLCPHCNSIDTYEGECFNCERFF